MSEPEFRTQADLIKFIRLIADESLDRRPTNQVVKRLATRPDRGSEDWVRYSDIERDALRSALEPILRDAEALANRRAKSPRYQVGMKDIRKAMRRSSCHYVWFC
jgi:hypothetical protein